MGALVGQAGFGAVSIDQDRVADWDAVAAFVDGAGALFLGCLPTAREREWNHEKRQPGGYRFFSGGSLGATLGL